ncbi:MULTISPECIES: hypothetical protein [unclassified Streptomyces]|uniref:hypothetical protein n=1 Tax=unclassified Streptomyces TaxID=2593676 RepID=UPI002DDAC714|nr:hypothetical protein [Streptomyces sp. NBC_01766]WSC24907.1 hypothetical protein OIE60_35150 [Streptomyces sp. NBC_01766]
MDDMSNATGQLMELVARAAALSDPAQLRNLLQTGHTAWCEGLAEVRGEVFRRCAELDDAAVADWCRTAESPWEKGQPRSEAVSYLAFAVWDSSPAAMAYTVLEERASSFGVTLIAQ